MYTKHPLVTKFLFVAMILGMAFSFLPGATASAAGLDDETTPPDTEMRTARLEKTWARLQETYERQGNLLDRGDALVEKIQSLIDRANDNGRNTSAVQAALDVLEQALKDAHPIYQSANGIIASHQGFDDQGKVTDRAKAWETVKSLGEHVKEVRSLVGEPFKLLREAIKAFREANRPVRTGAESIE